MSRHTLVDRFTLPKDIPDLAPDLAPALATGEIPSPTDACWSQPGGGDPVDLAPVPANAPEHPQASAPDGEAVRGYVMRSAAGRGWAPEEEAREPVTMVEGLPCTAEDLRLREAGEGGAPLHARPQSRSGPAPLLTPRRQAEFCTALAAHGNVRLACRAVRVSAQTAYRARRASAAFRQCWEAALVLARDHAEQVLADRALNGVEEKVFYHGEEVATRTRYDSRLLLAHLARLDAKAKELATCESCDVPLVGEGDFDAAVAHLGAGSDTAAHAGSEEGADFDAGLCSRCSTLAAEEEAERAERRAQFWVQVAEEEAARESEDAQDDEDEPAQGELPSRTAEMPDMAWNRERNERRTACEGGEPGLDQEGACGSVGSLRDGGGREL